MYIITVSYKITLPDVAIDTCKNLHLVHTSPEAAPALHTHLHLHMHMHLHMHSTTTRSTRAPALLMAKGNMLP